MKERLDFKLVENGIKSAKRLNNFEVLDLVRNSLQDFICKLKRIIDNDLIPDSFDVELLTQVQKHYFLSINCVN